MIIETDADGNPLTLAEINERKELARLREASQRAERPAARDSVIESAASPPKAPENSFQIARKESNAGTDDFLAEQVRGGG